MAKVKAPFQITGTIDDLNFYINSDNQNIARSKGKTGISSKQFHTNPIFQTIKNHNKEFARAVELAKTFRMLAHPLFQRAKEGSFAGRANKLMLEIIQEDTVNLRGKRTFDNGLMQEDTFEYFLEFEGNKTRPLKKTLLSDYIWNTIEETVEIQNCNVETDIIWPDEATHVHIMTARANWDFQNNIYETTYSEEIYLEKNHPLTTITSNPYKPAGKNLHFIYLFIGFSTLKRKKVMQLKRKYNTVSICKVINYSKQSL